MPNRIIKESVWTSENLSKLSITAQGFFFRLLPLPDDHGCFDARTVFLRTRLFPFCLDRVSEKQIEGWLMELQSVDCIRLWVHSDGIRYGVFPKWSKHQVIRSLHMRKTPAPPENVSDESKGDVTCKQLHANECLNPNLNRNPNPNPGVSSETKTVSDSVGRVWLYYLEKLGKNPNLLELSQQRKFKGKARFAEALRKTSGDAEKAEALLKLAVDALAASPHHMGENDRGKRYDSWEKNLFPSQEKLEWWLERAP